MLEFLAENRDMAFRLFIVSTEAFALVVCFILLYGNRHETHRKTKYGNVYSCMVISNIIALIADAISWGMEGMTEYVGLLFAANVITIVIALVMIAQFLVYIAEYLRERTAVSDKLLRAGLVFCSVMAAATLAACLCGAMFTMENGVFSPLPLFIVYSVAAFVGTIFCFVTVIYYRKALGTHDSIAAYVYIMFSTAGALVNLYFDNLSLTYQFTTLSLLVLYVMIQSEQGNILLEERQISEYYAEHDELTGLLSRRAYEEKLWELKKSEKGVGVIFCDMNGLKFTNDNFGHEEGDEMIRSFTGILKNYFHNKEIYRISGDEFIIIQEQTDIDSFYENVEGLEDLLSGQEKEFACFGVDYGTGEDMERLVRNAESVMYKKKEEFYRHHPEMKRTH